MQLCRYPARKQRLFSWASSEADSSLVFGVGATSIVMKWLGNLAVADTKLLPEPSKQENFLLWAIREDDYYHLLVPVTVPVAVVAVYLNWFSINLFKSS